MTYDFHIHDVVRVEYRVSTDGPAFPRGYARIEDENRVAGGNGVVAAQALASWGAKVLLTSNVLGDDSHGQFLRDSLAGTENLTYEPQIQAGFATPYAILIRAGKFDAGALLSPSAAQVPMTKARRDASVARYFIGATDAWGETPQEIFLHTDTQDYPALVGAISNVAAVYLKFMASDWPQEMQSAFNDAVVELFRAKFHRASAIPTLEEVEAFLNRER